jgi:hypothetical protein
MLEDRENRAGLLRSPAMLKAHSATRQTDDQKGSSGILLPNRCYFQNYRSLEIILSTVVHPQHV